MDRLLGAGLRPDVADRHGRAPLLDVSQTGRADVIEWFLAHGARLDARNSINETPLNWPLVNGFVDLVERLWPRAEAGPAREAGSAAVPPLVGELRRTLIRHIGRPEIVAGFP